jgi:TRAP transporter TAXI family solute receptor
MISSLPTTRPHQRTPGTSEAGSAASGGRRAPIRQLSQPDHRGARRPTVRLPWRRANGCGRHCAVEAPGRLAVLGARACALLRRGGPVAPRDARRPRRGAPAGTGINPPQLSRRTALATVSLAAVAGLGSLDGDSVVPEYPGGLLRLATGPAGGVYSAYGRGIANVVRHRLPRLRVTVLRTQASVQNMHMLAGGTAEVAFCLADAAAAARAGQPPFTAPLDVVALARLYDNYMHLVVRADGPLRTVQDLRGRRVAIGSPGSGTELLTLRLLKVCRIDPDRDIRALRINVDAAAPALGAGKIDAFFFSGGVPVAAIMALTGHLRLLELGELVGGMQRYGEFYSERTIPGRPYRLADPVSTVGEPNFLMVARRMDERVAYQLTKALFAGRDELAAAHPEGRRLDRGAAIATYPLPLHPGAVRYYREVKR